MNPVPWPMLTPVKARALMLELPNADALHALADRVTHYPGGGAQAHRLRTAAGLIADVRDYLDEHREAQ